MPISHRSACATLVLLFCLLLLRIDLSEYYSEYQLLSSNGEDYAEGMKFGGSIRNIRYHRLYQPPPQLGSSEFGGYFNLTCPYEMSKYSCSYRQVTWKDANLVKESTEYYLEYLGRIHEAYNELLDLSARREAEGGGPPIRVFFTGDSLMRQVFIALSCGAHSHPAGSLIESAEVPWKDDWFTEKLNKKLMKTIITSGRHGGFDAASISLKGGLEVHFVPHHGYKDEETSEENLLDRLASEIATTRRITFGDRTATPMGESNVDVLVYNVGIHGTLDMHAAMLRRFVDQISLPLLFLARPSEVGQAKTKTIYVTTPTQHYNTSDGQWQWRNMTQPYSKRCLARVANNPRSDLEMSILKHGGLSRGGNVDRLVEYGDLDLGSMHMRHTDCSHYCLPGVPDVVAARLLQNIVGVIRVRDEENTLNY